MVHKNHLILGFLAATIFLSSSQAIFAQDPGENIEIIKYTDPAPKSAGHTVEADKSLGSHNSPYIVYIFGDLNEPFTQKFFSEIFPELNSKYGPESQFVYRHNSISEGDPDVKSILVECLAQQSAFWNNINPLLTSTNPTDLANINLDNLASCQSDPKTKLAIKEAVNNAKFFGLRAMPIILIQPRGTTSNTAIKVTGAQPINTFDQAFSIAKGGLSDTSKIEQVENKINSLEQSVNQTQQRVSLLDEKIQQLESIINSLLDRIRQLFGL